MGKQRFILALAAFCLSCNALASIDNPFEKVDKVDITSSASWNIDAKNKTATRSGADSGLFYHLFYDRKQLRLRITENAEDTDANAKNYEQFSVYDVLVDGKRLPAFNWCLNNQERHSRYLQQGLTVSQGVCVNQGEVGTFIMKLNMASLKTLKGGKKLTFSLKPFRTMLNVNFDISDFSDVVASLNESSSPVAAKPESKAKPVAKAAPPVLQKKCKASPPAGYSAIKAIEYDCNDAAAKSKATADINAAVNKERERQKQLAAERERKRKEAEAAKKAKEERIAAEKAALAASEAQRAAISSEISNKMIAVCKKKWAIGEHRCYCQKYIEHAPADIKEKSKSQCGS